MFDYHSWSESQALLPVLSGRPPRHPLVSLEALDWQLSREQARLNCCRQQQTAFKSPDHKPTSQVHSRWACWSVYSPVLLCFVEVCQSPVKDRRGSVLKMQTLHLWNRHCNGNRYWQVGNLVQCYLWWSCLLESVASTKQPRKKSNDQSLPMWGL